MSHRRVIVTLLATVIVLCGSVALCDEMKREMSAAIDAVRPALIRIHVVSADFRQGREMKIESGGSGVIVSPDGYAVTNHHVAAQARRIVVTLADKREVDAELVGTDPLADVAVIKLKSDDGKPFPAASFGDSSKLEVGDRVFAMGSPLSLSQSVTSGIVSNTEMVMPDGIFSDRFKLDGEDVGSIVRWIGHDALIRPGNSGGPLVSPDGKIVGINEISFGLSGAIPSNLAREVAEQIITGGKVVRSWLGISVQPLLESSGLKTGVLVGGVLDDSPARKAGLQSGDVILSIDGTPVTAQFKEQIPIFNQFVAGIAVGKSVKIGILRAGKESTLSAVTEERRKAMEDQHEIRGWGLCGSDITYMTQKEMLLPSRDGVLVWSVLPSGPAGAAKPTLDEQDVIIRVGTEPVKDVASLRAITKGIMEGKDEPVPTLVHFLRRNKEYATVVKVGKRELSEPGAEISKAWLPVETQVLTRDLATSLGIEPQGGVRVTQVFASSSATAAGLRVGDVIVRLDGEEIEAEQAGDEEVFPSMIRQYEPDSVVKLSIVRESKPLDVEAKLQTSPKLPRDYPKYENTDLGFTARDIAFADRADGWISETQAGAYVESVTEGGWSALGGLRTGDVVTEVNDLSIASLEALESGLKGIVSSRPKTVVFKVVRGIHTQYLEIEPTWDENGG